MTLGKLLNLSELLSNGNSACLKGLLKVLNEKHSMLILDGKRGIGVTVIDSSASMLPAYTAHQFPLHSFIPQTCVEHQLCDKHVFTEDLLLPRCVPGISGE